VVFVAFALCNNISGSLRLGDFRNVEALGFAFFLGTLGYVAAKRSLHRDHQFSEIQKELEIARRIRLRFFREPTPNPPTSPSPPATFP
jgi:sigma-B regulation protein RsbU (phosphoserine phosphatase)